MTRPVCRVDVYKRDGDNNYSSSADFSFQPVQLDCDQSYESNADSFQFNVLNPLGTDQEMTGVFRQDDRIMIYLGEDSINTGSDLVFDGFVDQTTNKIDSSERTITVNGLNRIEMLLNFSYPAHYNNDYVHTIIINLLNAANDGRMVNGQGVVQNKIGPLDINSQITESSWDSFGNYLETDSGKKLNYSKGYTPVFEMIEELASESKNGVANFVYYLDSDNNFVFERRTSTIAETLTEGEDFYIDKTTFKVWDVKNAMIIDCGEDAYNRTVLALNYNETSTLRFGLKWFPSKESTADVRQRIVEELQFENIIPDDKDTIFPDSYPQTLPWSGRNDDGSNTGSDVVVNNDSEFNSALRTELRWQGIAWSESQINKTGYIRPRADLTLRGIHWKNNLNKVGVAQLIYVESKTMGWTDGSQEAFRIMQISHSFSESNGWEVTLHLEKDPDSTVLEES